MGDRLGVAESLLALAAAVLPAEPADAARLLGASSAVLSAVGAVPTPRQEADLDRRPRRAERAGADAAPRPTRRRCRGRAVALALDLGDRLGAARVHARTT